MFILGVAINGVYIFNPLTSAHLNAVEGGATEQLDSCAGHSSPSEDYHYHKLPEVETCMGKVGFNN